MKSTYRIIRDITSRKRNELEQRKKENNQKWGNFRSAYASKERQDQYKEERDYIDNQIFRIHDLETKAEEMIDIELLPIKISIAEKVVKKLIDEIKG